ncbi:MAG: hypothetical protein GC137_05905 [Alphaproteobacteria bacterium]|nr:hypothetical protein [Alphaproteobacteria bacterium]
METLGHIKYKCRKNLPIFIGLFLCLYFSYHTLSGSRSYSRLLELEQSLDLKAVHLDKLTIQRSHLEEKVSMMRTATLSSDMLDEQTRFMLGYNSDNEYVIITK